MSEKHGSHGRDRGKEGKGIMIRGLIGKSAIFTRSRGSQGKRLEVRDADVKVVEMGSTLEMENVEVGSKANRKKRKGRKNRFEQPKYEEWLGWVLVRESRATARR